MYSIVLQNRKRADFMMEEIVPLSLLLFKFNYDTERKIRSDKMFLFAVANSFAARTICHSLRFQICLMFKQEAVKETKFLSIPKPKARYGKQNWKLKSIAKFLEIKFGVEEMWNWPL